METEKKTPVHTTARAQMSDRPLIPADVYHLVGVIRGFTAQYGREIFFEENEALLLEKVRLMSGRSTLIKRAIQFLVVMGVPKRLCGVIDFTEDQFSELYSKLLAELVDFGVVEKKAQVLIAAFVKGLGLKYNVPALDVDVDYETWADLRDGEVYKTCKIGDQVWLAENFRYEPGVVTGLFAYENNYADFDKYGFLYTYESLMRVVPDGWHLPTKEEIEKMIRFVSNDSRCESRDAYKLLASKEWKGEDKYGFAALPGGARSACDNFHGKGSIGYWWGEERISKTMFETISDSIFHIVIDKASVGIFEDKETCDAFSVRLIKDEEKPQEEVKE